MNTLQFGQKAKNVKTTVNVNEVEAASKPSSEVLNDLAKAKKQIKVLEDRVKFLESNNSKNGGSTDSTSYIYQQLEFMQTQNSKLQEQLDERDLSI